MATIKRRHSEMIIRALKAGVVPRVGVQHILVNRVQEIKQIKKDFSMIIDGSSTVRFIVGDYGSGKTFFLNLSRLLAFADNLVVMRADLAPNRRLYSADGKARVLYAEMTRNIATRNKPTGGAMTSIVERFVNKARSQAEKEGVATSKIIRQRTETLEELTGGYDFATVIDSYWRGFDQGNDELQNSALRWLRAEYSTKTDAKNDLGVRTIISDANIYDHLKLMSLFVRLAGYQGLVILLDEMSVLYKLASSQSRISNYEQILRIVNDVLQGSASHISFLFGGTNEFLNDPRRGLFSYKALQQRLADNVFTNDGLVDFSGPVIRLNRLSKKEFHELLRKVRQVFQSNNSMSLPDEALNAFMDHCQERIGNAYFQTPRNSIKAFSDFLAILEQNPKTNWRQLLNKVDITPDNNGDNDELTSFKI